MVAITVWAYTLSIPEITEDDKITEKIEIVKIRKYCIIELSY
jgi:hypothetical protein